MKKCFVPKKFTARHGSIIAMANQILDEYANMGYDLSLRQLYYQFVARDILKNNQKNYKMLGGVISEGRLAGKIDWDMIRDRGRVTMSVPHWASPSDIMRESSERYRIDKWERQDNYVEVMVEKQALEGVLLPVCETLDVPFTSNKGFASRSIVDNPARIASLSK